MKAIRCLGILLEQRKIYWARVLKKLFKLLIPPLFFQIYSRLCKRDVYWTGNHSSWAQALAKSDGYGSDMIFEQTKQAALAVKDCRAVFMRDGVTFEEIQYSWPVLAGLLWAATHFPELSVLDFGGSLGSSYYQNKKFLAHLPSLRWSIVEQTPYVEFGRSNLEDANLKFYNTTKECCTAQKVNVILLSSVLAYLEKPYEMLESLIGLEVPIILLDRTAFLLQPVADERLTIQHCPTQIYPASYPAWFLGQEKFLKTMLRKYELIEEFDSFGKINVSAKNKGFIFRLKQHAK